MGNKIDKSRILNEIASVVSQSLDLNEILTSALEMVLSASNMNTGGNYLLNEATQDLTIAVQRGFNQEFISGIDNIRRLSP